jgi:hypothetical protein
MVRVSWEKAGETSKTNREKPKIKVFFMASSFERYYITKLGKI